MHKHKGHKHKDKHNHHDKHEDDDHEGKHHEEDKYEDEHEHEDKHKRHEHDKDEDNDVNDFDEDEIEELENKEEENDEEDIDIQYLGIEDIEVHHAQPPEHALNKSTVCQLINASIEEEAKAAHDYVDILEVIPASEEYTECAEIITEILEDEVNHALALIKMGKKLGCKKPELKRMDEELLKTLGHIHKIEIE